MATIINKSGDGTDNSGMGFLFGIIILLILGFLIFVYGLPYLRGVMGSPTQVNVPGKVDVNIKQTK